MYKKINNLYMMRFLCIESLHYPYKFPPPNKSSPPYEETDEM